MTPITLASHRTLGWRPARGYAFARSYTQQAIAVAEIPRCAQTIPVVFGKFDDVWAPVAVMGESGGHNVYVDESGRWLGGYVPVAFRFYPFILKDRKLFLWPGFSAEPAGAEGTKPFFSGTALAEGLTKAAAVLARTAQSNKEAQPVFDLLERCDVLKPWLPPQGSTEDKVPPSMELFQVDRKSFEALGDYDWLGLRRFRAHAWIYAHLESLHLAERLTAISGVETRPAGYAGLHPSPQPVVAAGIDGFLAALSRETAGV